MRREGLQLRLLLCVAALALVTCGGGILRFPSALHLRTHLAAKSDGAPPRGVGLLVGFSSEDSEIATVQSALSEIGCVENIALVDGSCTGDSTSTERIDPDFAVVALTSLDVTQGGAIVKLQAALDAFESDSRAGHSHASKVLFVVAEERVSVACATLVKSLVTAWRAELGRAHVEVRCVPRSMAGVELSALVCQLASSELGSCRSEQIVSRPTTTRTTDCVAPLAIDVGYLRCVDELLRVRMGAAWNSTEAAIDALLVEASQCYFGGDAQAENAQLVCSARRAVRETLEAAERELGSGEQSEDSVRGLVGAQLAQLDGILEAVCKGMEAIMYKRGVVRASQVLLSVHKFHMQRCAVSLESLASAALMKMQLEGSYNPFVRRLPFPPLRVNVNYLVKPGKTVDRRLYDEHTPGVCIDRARPLEFDGVARFPFDCNEVPVPRERAEPWYGALTAYLRP